MLTEDVRPMPGQAEQVAPDLVIAGLGGLPDLGQHGVALLLPLGVDQADAHVLLHLGQWDELACDGRHHRPCRRCCLLLGPACHIYFLSGNTHDQLAMPVVRSGTSLRLREESCLMPLAGAAACCLVLHARV